MSDDCKLYLVTDENLSLLQLKKVVQESIEAGVSIVQLREKNTDLRDFIQRAKMVKELLKDTDIPLIINDRVDVALAIDADGVHLGQSDLPVQMARDLLGENKIIGLTVENMQELILAQSLPIDHIGLSSVFATKTKLDIKNIWGLDGLEKALKLSNLPIVAIGGITIDNANSVKQTGVYSLAVTSAICSANEPYKAVNDFLNC